jgi:prevent-host-death family protein
MAKLGSPDTWNLTDAKAKLSSVVQRALDGQPQRIVRNGRESVMVVSESEYRPPASSRSVVQLFSALQGIDLDLERDRDSGRNVPDL